MPTTVSINLKVRYGRFVGNYESMVMSVSEFINNFLTGVTINLPKTAAYLNKEAVKNKILSAQQQVENTLSLKLWEQPFMERRQFSYDRWSSWAFMPTSHMVKTVYSMGGFLADTQQVNYPITWMSIQRSSDERQLYRNLNIVAVGANAQGVAGNVVTIGIVPFLGSIGVQNIPNYWQVTYLTGFKNIPSELVEMVGRIAAVSIWTDLQDIVQEPGIASKSISYDGLSETVSTVRTGEYGIFGAKIAQYQKYIDREMPKLIDFYVGINNTVL